MTTFALRIEDDAVEFDGVLDLAQGPVLGPIKRLARDSIEVALTNMQLASRVSVSDLVALPTEKEFVIGMVEAISRSIPGAGSGELRGPASDHVAITVTPIGALEPGGDQSSASFSRGASSYPHIDGDCHLIEGDHLEAFLAILAHGVAPEERLVLGSYLGHRADAVADGNRLFQRHLALLGSTGTGKSWAVALMLQQAAKLEHANVIVFDIHGEYRPLTQSIDGRPPIARGLRVAAPSDLGLTQSDVLYLPYWMLRREELMALVGNEHDPNASEQAMRYTEHVQTLKQISLSDAGRQDAAGRFTVDSPIPYQLNHLLAMLQQDNTERIPQHPSNRVEPGPYFGTLTGLISRMESRAADPRFGFIFDPPKETLEYDWLMETAAMLLEAGNGTAGIKIIDLSEVPSGVIPIVVAVIARFIYDLQFWMDPDLRVPICLVCDEAHVYLPSSHSDAPSELAALAPFESIAKEGRKYGVALFVISQRPTEVSRTILSQCNNYMVMRLANDADQAIIERLVPDTVGGLHGVLPLLDVGETVVIGDAVLLTSRIKLSEPEIKPASATQPYWTMWSQKPSSRDAIEAGVEALRNQMRGESQPRSDPSYDV